MKSKLLFAALTAAVALSASAENWSQWRGPGFNGSSPEKNLPVKFSPTENVAWVRDMPGPSAATPAVHGDHIFVSSTDERVRTLQALALDRKTGKVLWNHKVSDGTHRDNRSNYSAPSPVTDGKLAVFFYGNGALAAFSADGKRLWSRNLQDDYGAFGFQWTFSASPLLHNGILYQQVLQRDTPVHGAGGGDSYLLAMNPQTGKTLWKHIRPAQAEAESLEAFSTPIPNTHNGRDELIVVGGDCLTGHDPKTGKELWRWGTWNENRIGHWRLVPSPVTGGGVVLACAPKREPIYAVKLGGQGNLGTDGLAWKSEDRSVLSSDVPTPAFYDGDFFILSDVRNALSRAEPRTGKIKWTIELPRFRKWRSSPTAADGRIYIMNHGGQVFVVDAENGEILNETKLGDEGDDNIRASIVVSQGQLFVRTNSKLYCIGRNAKVAAR